jgi:hypothetical protein
MMLKSASIREQLDEEIRQHQSEVDRLEKVANVEYPAAVAKLEALQKLAADVTPAFEEVAGRLAKGGIDIPINEKVPRAEPPATAKEFAMQVSTVMPALNVPQKKTAKKGKKR